MRTTFWSRLLDLIAPRQCVVCGRRLTLTERSVCSACYLHLPRTVYQFSPADNPMAQMFWGLSPVSRAAAQFFYEPHSEAARLVYTLKYGSRPDIGVDLGRMMAEEMTASGFLDGVQVLVPVPLSRRRQRQRGYNQSEMLARGLSEVTGLPVETGVLRRRSFGQSQTHLRRAERRQNVDTVFYGRNTTLLEGRHVLLIDDVCTTGATLTACADALRTVSGIRLSVLTLCLTKS